MSQMQIGLLVSGIGIVSALIIGVLLAILMDRHQNKK